ncbi:hypothetical protein BAU15_15080 [Enterococcus sp. JM4C]|nr:hypothetical protein BAU15_15080 [Enterococcus sp. JM4C]
MKDLSKKQLLLAFVTFLLFMLELFSLGLLEPLLFNVTYNNYTVTQKGFHWLITAVLWFVPSIFLVRYSNRLGEKINYRGSARVTLKNWVRVGALLFACKMITFIDWQTLKVIGEFDRKGNLYLFSTQYLYYFVEVFLLLLIVVFAQKAFDIQWRDSVRVPFGGLFLAITWGAFHFVSTGGDFWNGLSCMIFSIICGWAYLYLNKNVFLFYLFLIVGYLL